MTFFVKTMFLSQTSLKNINKNFMIISFVS